MPAQQFTVTFQRLQELFNRLEGELRDVGQVSEATAIAIDHLQQALGAIYQGREIIGTYRTLAQAIQQVGKEAGLTSKRLEVYNREYYNILRASEAGATAKQPRFALLPTGADPRNYLGLPDLLNQNKTWQRVREAAQRRAGGLADDITGGEDGPRYQALGTAAGRAELASKVPGGMAALENVNTQLKRWGSNLTELNHINLESNGQLVRWSANVKLVGDVTERVSVVTNAQGDILTDLQRRYRSFFSAIGRDIGEFLKWSIAASVIYVPLRKLNELTEESIKLQSKLADVQIALGASNERINQVFESSANIAREVGVSVAGVIDSYSLAIRATGGIEDQNKRAAVAEILLRDSMILAKLAGIDQAKAMDTLVGALRQAGYDLTEGTKLLDKWVAITKVANVDLATLAASFAITATAAEDAGVDFDKLNGIIAAVAEASILSAEETGNAVRAFIAGFQSSEAQKELQKYGIAVRDVEGQLRSFVDIVDEIVEMSQRDLITDRQLTEISNALGGGYRRGAQIALFLRNYGRAQELAAVSAEANGDAAEALGTKLATLETAATNLQNAFSELARALGQDGGFLDSGTQLLELATKLVDGLTSLVRILGTATPKIIAFSAAWAVLTKTTAGKGLVAGAQGLFGAPGFGPEAGPVAMNKEQLPAWAASGYYPGMGSFFPRANYAVSSIKQQLARTFTPGSALTGAGVGLAYSAGDIAQGNWGKVGVQIGGAIAGTLVGGPVGGLLGAAIANAFYDNVVEKKTDLRKLFAPPGIDPETGEPTVEKKDPVEEIIRLIGKGSALGGGSKTGEAVVSYFGAITGQEREQVAGALAGLLSGIEPETTGIERGALAFLLGPNFGKWLTPEDRELIGSYLAILRQEAEKVQREAKLETPFGIAQEFNVEQFGQGATQTYKRLLEEHRENLSKGLITPSELKEFENQGTAIATSVGKVYTALGEESAKALTGTKTSEDAFAALADLILTVSPDISRALYEQSEAYAAAVNAGDRQGVAAAARERKNLARLVSGAIAGSKYQEFQIPSPVLVAAGTSRQQINEVINKTIVDQERLMKDITLDPDEQQKIIDSYVDVWVQIGDELGQILGGFNQKVNLDVFKKNLEQAGLLGGAGGFGGVQQLDFGSELNTQFQRWIEHFDSFIAQTLVPMGYEMKEEDWALLYNDNIAKPAHADSLAIQLALAQLIDLNEKQLEGVFNLPEGMAALLPVTGNVYFSNQPINRGGSGFGFPTPPPGGATPVEVVNFPPGAFAQEPVPGEELSVYSRLAQNTPVPGEELKRDYGIDLEKVMTKRVQARMAELDAAWLAERGRDEERQRMEDYLNLAATGREAKPPIGAGYLGAGGYGMAPTDLGIGQAFNTLMSQLTSVINTMFPEQLPITNNVELETTNVIYIDGSKLQQESNKQLFKDFKLAKRRTGTLGFVAE